MAAPKGGQLALEDRPQGGQLALDDSPRAVNWRWIQPQDGQLALETGPRAANWRGMAAWQWMSVPGRSSGAG